MPARKQVPNYRLEVSKKPVEKQVNLPANQPIVVRGCTSTVGCAIFPNEQDCGSFKNDCYIVSTGKAIEITGPSQKDTGNDYVPYEVLLAKRSHWKVNEHLDHGKFENTFFPDKIVPAQNPFGY